MMACACVALGASVCTPGPRGARRPPAGGRARRGGRPPPRARAACWAAPCTRSGASASARDAHAEMAARPLRIMMSTDFFYPDAGGVECHVYSLAQGLIARGHAVCVLTRSRGARRGVRWMTNGLKVYYAPRLEMPWGTSLPTAFGSAALVRAVALREAIDVVHAHQNCSALAHEAVHAARALGIPCAFTDHSLFGFADTASILTNQLLRWTLAEIQAVVCVSHVSKENSVLRSGVRPELVYVIPNAVDAEQFAPREASHSGERPGSCHGHESDGQADVSSSGEVASSAIDDAGGTGTDVSSADPYLTVVVMNRLTYRKGVDLLVQVVPAVCASHPGVRFVIGGDGPRRGQLEQMVELHGLQRRVELLGAVRHDDVCSVLNRGRVFLSCSLTEAFCMAVVEAAAAGLMVVSTRVGGVPEVLPPDLMLLAEPEAGALAAAVLEGIERAHPETARASVHARVAAMYSWPDVAKRTEVVYQDALGQPRRSLRERLACYASVGGFMGVGFAAAAAYLHLFMGAYEFFQPAKRVQKARPFQAQRYMCWAATELAVEEHM